MTPKEAFERLSKVLKITKIQESHHTGWITIHHSHNLTSHIQHAGAIEWGDTTSYQPPAWRPATEADIGKDARFFSRNGELSHLGKLEVVQIHVWATGRSLLYKPEELASTFSICEVQE